MTHLAVDAMGGDAAPSAIVDGAVAAARHLDIQISLVGAPAAIEPSLDRHADWRRLRLAVVSDAIAMANRFATDGFIQRVERDIAAATVSHQ